MGADAFALAAALITVVLVIALVAGARFASPDERRNEHLISAALVAASLIGVAAIILAAVSGPHPS
jgi:Co/Zn/Cd efflux system component